MPQRFWLMKSEPETFSIDDLKKRPKKTEPWDGVRNYQARNFMRDQMQVGDGVFFYHSNCEVPGIYGLAEIASTAYPDPTQFDPQHHHYDPGSKPEEPRWLLVDVRYQRHLKRPITLETLRQHEKQLQGLAVIARGNRLSVMPVRPEHWQAILALE
ncbi:EVE domain-containing protein [Stagnimonas aquatica]|uniref:EVE domain-containing protein n=1 Tax=Stagnimonas aquatica TaxID=2689987 RepID=A0A3N0VKU9_9GAMM|nr:EVE domain-containing protein [Stagnimonas aquatica]ROH93331.1 EVE domain-containing protein [Stagnimonas aquatica]